MFQMLDRIDAKLRARVEKVAVKAVQFGDKGVADWAVRATNDALALGRMRDRDVATLARLEDTYGHEFYNGNGGGTRLIHA